MAINPKLEFYRFELNPKKKDEFKTFRSFAIDELKSDNDASKQKIVESIFNHFIRSLEADFAKDDKLKKQIALVERSDVNKYLNLRPAFKSDTSVIHGVINGGPYGRERILAEVGNRKEVSQLGQNKSVLLYFYFLLYVPTDHNEGCFIIHSNSKDESITQLFINFISHLFKGNIYNRARCESFCPKSFQDEFKRKATLQSMMFKKTFTENVPSTDGLSSLIQQYDIKIQATPKNKNILVSEAIKLKNFLEKKVFGNAENPNKLYNFEEAKIQTKNSVTKSTKSFEWNKKDNEFVPVIYLEGRIQKYNSDSTPDFEELQQLCFNYFNDEVLPELRPDLDVTRAK